MILKWNVGTVPEKVFEYTQSSYLDVFITYLIDHRYRTAVSLKSWIKEQLDNPTDELITASGIATKTLSSKATIDDKAIACLKYVIRKITYESDSKIWNTEEKWQTAQETLTKGTGDCEDGAILMYILCRLNGVPENRLLLICGNVEGGGHCWLAYKPNQYPINWCFLDWCYWPNEMYPDNRPKFYIQNQKIYGEDSRYYSIWFGFNASKSYTELKNRWDGVSK